ncbi:MAG TPA: TonB-dependent receptor [Pyrinomonadaceae bacterium]|jgi:outer membrane receptor protein involved in Fe transport|nr:TonB-dependent receptor [Pyrinomonadaceae bacterium]
MKTGYLERWLVLAFLAMVIVASSAMSFNVLAQTSNTGTVTGVVKDEKGGLVPGASVKIVNVGTNAERSTTTTSDGVYEITQLVPGNYRLEVQATGFSKYVQEPVVVNVLQRTTANADLKVGGIGETVTVTGETAPLVETTKTDVSGVIDQRRLESLPVNGRSFASLAILIPGATLQPSFDPTKARVGTFSVGGSTGRNLNITIDGGDNKDNAVGGILQNFSMEGIQEFALSTQRFSAANGRSGGALLSVVSKSGTNDFHGSVFGFFRDDALNANAPKLLAEANPDLFPNAADAVKPPFSRQQFGGSIGGPIKKDKAFFFGTVERTRERGNSIVPGVDQAKIGFLQPFGYQAVQFLPQPFNDWQYTVKGDFNLSPKHTLVTRFAGQNNNALNDQAGFLVVRTDLSGGNESLNTLYNFLASLSSTFNSTTVNQFTYQFQSFDNRINATTDLNLLVFPDGLAVGRNGNVPQQTLQKKHQFRDDLTWNRGNHGFKFGGDFTYVPTLGGLFAFNSAPEYDFNFNADEIAQNPAQFPQGFKTTQVLPGSVTCPAIVGTATCTAADLDGTGVVADVILSGGDPNFDLRDGAKQFAFYAQDDWKITPRLTLNIGVRYDVDFGFVDHAHAAENRAFQALQIIGSPFAHKVVEDDKNNLSPRIGFAWDVRGDGRSVLRGGYGVYFDQSFLNVPLFAVQQANPEIYATFINDGANLSITSPPPVVPRPLNNPLSGTRGRMLDPDFESPYTQQWNLGYAQEFGKNMALEFDYIHILGLHEFSSLDINPRIGPLINAQRSSPNPGRVLTPLFAAHAAELTAKFGTATPFARITVAQSDSRSRYDAFTVAFKKRYSNKFQLNAHYTLAKSQAWFGATADFGLQPQNLFAKFDPINFGPTGEDERHRFVVSGIFDLPWDFQIAPIFQMASARPYSIFPACGCDINRDGVTNDRESVNPGIDDQHKVPLNDHRGDNFSQLNVRVSKFFKFRENMKLGLFFEAFNVFNTGNYGNQFQNTTGEPDFGKPINFFGATGFSEPLGIPFQAQLGVRFSF